MKITYKLVFVLIAMFYAMTAAANTVLVGNVLSNSVTLLDELTLHPIKEIKVGYMPHEINVTADGKIALVSNFGDLANVMPGNSITTIDVANAKVLNTIRLPNGSRPHGLALIDDSHVLVTAQGVQSLFLIDFINGVIERIFKLPGAGAHMVLQAGKGNYAYVANTDSGTVCKIDLKNNAIVAEVKIGKEAEGITLNQSRDLLLVTDRTDNYVAVLKTRDLSIIKYIPTANGPTRVVLFDDGKSAVVTNTVSGNAQIIDMESLSISKTFNTNSTFSPLPVPINVFVREDQKTAYVTNFFANNISLIDLINGKIVNTFKAGYMPDGIAVSKMTAVNTDGNTTDTMFNIGPLDINSNIENVWRVAKNVNDYERISNGAVAAQVDGDLAIGKKIILEIYKNKPKGKFIPKSEETVTIVDVDRKILAWVRRLPDGNYTERYQILEKIAEDKTRSTIVLRIPGAIGVATKLTLGDTVKSSLEELHKGIKAESEIHP